MIQINLLPWREQMRQLKKTQFTTSLALCIILSLFILFVFHVYYSSLAGKQDGLNAILSTEINDEQNALNEMSSKEDEKKSIDVQLKFIINLYSESYNAIRFLNELVLMVPNSILLTQIRRNGNQITLTGLAKSENDVTQLLDYISRSPNFNQPTLSAINLENTSSDNSLRNFKLTFEQKEIGIS
jgi:type IV pilus assembly protein PilN